MTKSNKTFEWLSKKSDEEKMARLSLAKKDGRKLMMKDKERKKAIAVKVLENIRAKRKALKEKEETSREKIEFLIQEILDSGGGGGGWSSRQHMDQNLAKGKGRRIKQLKAQINIRKLIKCTDHGPKIFVSKFLNKSLHLMYKRW